MAAAMVEVVGTCWVKPAKATKRHNYTLSPLDVFWSDYGYAKTVHFFKLLNGSNNKDNIHMEEVAEALKRSLSWLLCEYYPIAGRLQAVNDNDDADPGRTRGMPRMVVDCNDAGVEFVTARCFGVMYADLEATGFQQIQPLFQSLGQPRNRVQDPEQDPLLSVQVTFFPDRGMCMAFLADHAIFDGFSFFPFLTAWGECHSQLMQQFAVGGRKNTTGPTFTLPTPPVHMRGALLVSTTDTNDGASKQELPGVAATDDEDELARIVPMKCGYKHFSSVAHHLRANDSSVIRVGALTFSAQRVEEIKRAAAAAGGNMPRPFTTFECLAAYLWKRRVLAAARGSLIRDEDQDRLRVGLRFPVNIRPRLAPPLPPAYFGLAIIHVAVVPAPTARQLSHESLAATAARIRRALELSTTDASIRQQIRAYQEGDMRNITPFAAYITRWQRPPAAQASPHNLHSNYDGYTFVTEISDMHRLAAAMHKVEFGPDMVLDAAKPLAHRDEGLITISPVKGDPGAADVFANLRSPEVEAFCAFNESIV